MLINRLSYILTHITLHVLFNFHVNEQCLERYIPYIFTVHFCIFSQYDLLYGTTVTKKAMGNKYKNFSNNEISRQIPNCCYKFFNDIRCFVALFFIIAWFLIQFTNSDLPYWDSFTTSLSFVATWMLARKKIENWLVWIVVDAASVGIYIYKDLYPTAILFFCLTLLAIVGYRKWKLDLNKPSHATIHQR